MKKTTVIFLSLLLAAVLCACGGKPAESEEASLPETTAEAASSDAEPAAETAGSTEEAAHTVKVSGTDLLPYLFGYLSYEKDSAGYVLPYRFTAAQRVKLLSDSKSFVANSCSGIRLDIVGNFKNITVKYRLAPAVELQPQSFDVCENGKLTESVRGKDYKKYEDGLLTYQMTEPGRFTIWFPSYSVMGIAEIEADGPFEPAPQGAKVLVHGDSVTQGAFTENVSESFINTVARTLNWDILNQACSGYTFKRYPRGTFEYDPEYILVYYGYNDFSQGDDVQAECAKFLQELKDQYPQAKVIVISPAVKRFVKGEKEVTMMARLNSAGVSYWSCCEAMEQQAAALGYPFLKEYSLKRDPGLFQSDGIHPNTEGNALLGQDIAEQLKALIGP